MKKKGINKTEKRISLYKAVPNKLQLHKIISEESDINELGVYVVNLHFYLDAQLSYFVAKYATEHALYYSDKDKATFNLVFATFDMIVSDVSYVKKVKMLERLKEYHDPLPITISEFHMINNMRNEFSHPNTHGSKLKSYKNRDKYLKTLSELMKIYIKARDAVAKEIDPIVSTMNPKDYVNSVIETEMER